MIQQKFISRTLALTSFATVIAITGCSFTSPGYKEQQELASRGTFVNGTPEWVLVPTNRPGAVNPAEQGLIPTAFTQRSIGRDSRMTEEETTQLPETTIAQQREAKKALKGGTTDKTVSGPLNKLLETCPFLEADVTKTLTNEDTEARLASWNSLIGQCPSGAPLYVWAGKDYEKVGKLPEAGRNYEQAITLDHLNTEAAALLDELRKKQMPK